VPLASQVWSVRVRDWVPESAQTLPPELQLPHAV